MHAWPKTLVPVLYMEKVLFCIIYYSRTHGGQMANASCQSVLPLAAIAAASMTQKPYYYHTAALASF